jgi:hypothetical protein
MLAGTGIERESRIPSHTVAQTDIEVALQALEAIGRPRIEAAVLAAEQTSSEDEKQMLKNMQEKLQLCMNSLRENLLRMTKSMPDDEYEALFQRTARVVDASEEYSENCNTTSSSDALTEEDDTDCETGEMEEDLFLDRDAWARVKELRSHVREASERIGKLRNEIPRKALQLIQSEIALSESYRNDCHQTPTKRLFADSSDVHDYKPCSGNADSTAPDQGGNKSSSVSSATTEAMRDMEDSLHKLVSLINILQDKLPKELDSFQSTIEVVDRYVSKVSDNQNLNNHGEYVPSNPVERAMLLEETRTKGTTSIDNIHDLGGPASPQSRFLSYLGSM